MYAATIEGVKYCAKTSKVKGKCFFYPIIEFYGSKIGSQTYHINTPQPTRAKALTIAKTHIQNIKD